MSKKIISIILSLVLVLGMCCISAFAVTGETIYVVGEFSGWGAQSANLMTETPAGSGIYEATIKNFTGGNFKFGNPTDWDNHYQYPASGEPDLSFSTQGTIKFTIDTNTNEYNTEVISEGIQDSFVEIGDTIYYDNSSSNWSSVYIHSWTDQGSGTTWPGNLMTDEGNGVWSFTFTANEEGHNRVIFNGGDGKPQTGNLVYEGSGKIYRNGSFEDYEAIETTEPTTIETEPTTVETEPTTVETEPTTVETEPTTIETEPTTVETEPTSEETQPTTGRTDGKFTVTAKSNIAQAVSRTYSKADDKVTVTYYLTASKAIANSQFTISYDPTVLAIDETKHKTTNAFGQTKEVNFTPVFDKIGGTASNIFGSGMAAGTGDFNASSGADPYDFLTGGLDNVFLTITFNIVGNYDKDTDILLNVEVLNAEVPGAIPNTVDLIDYVYEGTVESAFEEDCQTLATLSEAAVIPTDTEPTSEDTQPTTDTEPTSEDTQPTTDTEPTSEDTQPTTDTEPTDTTPTESTPGSGFTVTATSNFTDKVSKWYTADDSSLTVYYTLQASKLITSGQWELTYDPSVLKISNVMFDTNGNPTGVLPNIEAVGGVYTNLKDETGEGGKAYGNFSDINEYYDFSAGETVLFKMTFDIVGNYTTDTTVDLKLIELVYVEKEESGFVVPGEYIQEGVLMDSFASDVKSNNVYLDSIVDPTDTTPTETTPTETTPTETEPTDTTPTETTPTETTPTETTPTETTPTDTTPTETTPTETTPTETTPTETTPTETTPTETTPTETTPTETTPTDTTPTETNAPTNAPTEAPSGNTPAPTQQGATSSVATPDSKAPTTGGGNSNTTGNGTVQTSDSPMAFVLLALLVAATGAVIVLRKRELDK